MSERFLDTLVAAVAVAAACHTGANAAETARAPVVVTVTAKGCAPNLLTVPAGTTTFQIVNSSTRALEWEILKGVMVVDERENIAPGFTQKLTTELEAGDYEITCGLLSNPRGKLIVAPGTTQATAAPATPTAADLVGPTAEYRVYLHGEIATLVSAGSALANAIRSGDLGAATMQFAAMRAAYLHVKPVAVLFGDLDGRIDAAPPEAGSEPASTGFGALAHGLLVERSTAGLAPVASALGADVARLRAQFKSVSASPEAMVKGAASGLAAVVAQASNAGALDRPADAADLRARLAGVRKIVELFQPIVAKTDKAGSERIAAELAEIDRLLPPTAVAIALATIDRPALSGALTALAGDVGKLASTLGLS